MKQSGILSSCRFILSGAMFAVALAATVVSLSGCVAANTPSGPSGSEANSRTTGATPGALATAEVNPRSLAATSGSYVSAVDESGRPRFVWAAGAQSAPEGYNHEQAARYHVGRHAASLGISPQIIDAAEPAYVSDMGAGGVIARIGQKVGGVTVYGAELRVLMRANHELVAITGTLHPSDKLKVTGPYDKRDPFLRSPAQALADALSTHFDVAISPSEIRQTASTNDEYLTYELSSTASLRMPQAARVKRVYFPEGDALVPAHFVEFIAGPAGETDSEGWQYLVAADDGRTLETRDLVAHDQFTYRVWAWPNGDQRPTDGPFLDFTPHPTGMPDNSYPGPLAPILVTIDSFNHAPGGASDSWLARGATSSSGNNVDAYTDRNPPDGFSPGDIRALTTSNNTFDRIYDLTLGPTSNNQQAMAGITQMFYLVNWMHDWFYDSGFDEAAGNAQVSNLGRGGVGGDPVHAEAQDFSGRNNANMLTPADGSSPRMQIYLWDGPATRSLTINPGNSSPAAGAAAFGPPSYNVTAPLVLGIDGVLPDVNDTCEAITNNVVGKIVLADRGQCSFKTKVRNAQTAGALGVIIVDNQVAAAPPTVGDDQRIATPITIPVVSVTLAEGNTLKAALAGGVVTATLAGAAAVDRDSTIDNTVVAHEWGHYLHHRLAQCGSHQCSAMSEGWADYNALFMLLRDGDNLDGTYAVGIYDAKSMGDSGYFGIRREPYSVDLARDGLRFRHISDGQPLPVQPQNLDNAPNSEVHHAGEVWASMMFDAYVALQKAGKAANVPFDTVRRTMSDYVVAGLKLTPVDATYTEQRDALLAAIAARSLPDLALVAQAFARRGAGSCAVSPPRDSQNLVGVVESSDVKPHLVIGTTTLDDSIRSCDNDGNLDADERGRLVVKVINAGPGPMMDARMVITSVTPGISFPTGTTLNMPVIAPYGIGTAVFEVDLDKTIMKMQPFGVRIEVDSASSCEGMAVQNVTFRVNYDELPLSATVDDVEANGTAWKSTGPEAANVWSRSELAPLSHAWRGLDSGHLTDTALESPDLVVGNNVSFVMSFDHRYKFEASPLMGTLLYYDGGVIELSTDGGMTWKDISTWVNPGYGGTITNVSKNPLSDRKGYIDQSAAYPNQSHVTLDLGKQLAGQTVRVRFRIGSDEATSDFGWEIDNIGFMGIANKPFATLVDNLGVCVPDDMAGLAPADLLVIVANPDLATPPDTDMTSLDVPDLTLNTDTDMTSTGAPDLGSSNAPDLATSPAVDLATLAKPDIATGADAGDQPRPVVSGCGCRVADRAPSSTPAPWLLGLTLAAGLVRRRRKAGSPSRAA